MAILRSIIAVLAGYFVFAISALALFAISGHDPHAAAGAGFMLFSILYGVFFGTVAGFLAAVLAKRFEIEHSLAVATLIAAAGAASLLTSGRSAVWTELAALLIMAPSAMAGGYLRMRQLRSAKP
jgi:hypothetical protein